MKILCVNKSYIPVRFCSKFSAIGKMYTGVAEPLYISGDFWEPMNWDDWLKKSLTNDWPENQEFINSVKQRIAIPKILRYTAYDKIPKATIRLNRKTIYERDKHICYICGHQFSESKLSLDHVVPISRGGKKHAWENIATCCVQCNWDKGDKTLQELKIKPKYMPYKPTISNIQRLKNSISTYQPEWKLFGL